MRLTEVTTLTSLGFVLRQRGDGTEAVDIIRSALAIARSCHDRFAQAYASRGLAGALVACGQARRPYRRPGGPPSSSS
ncbi:tetratricopeptide repeat protein [Streptosporangium lutulentum]